MSGPGTRKYSQQAQGHRCDRFRTLSHCLVSRRGHQHFVVHPTCFSGSDTSEVFTPLLVLRDLDVTFSERHRRIPFPVRAAVNSSRSDEASRDGASNRPARAPALPRTVRGIPETPASS